MLGLPQLRQAISEHYRAVYNLPFDPDRQIVVTAGATEALAASLLALIAPGDEVVLFQPMFDVYLPLVRQAGGTPRFVTLTPPDYRITAEALEAAFSPKTRIVVFNSPQNPAAVVYDPAQLELLADVCRRFDVTAICDEVWEHVIFDGRRHLPLCALPGMAERTVKIGSGGKMFSLTGWKVGWACAPAALASVIAKAHQFLTFTVAPATQAAVAYGLSKPAAYFDDLRAGFQRSRDRLADGLAAAGFVTLPSQGTYFLNIDLPASGVSLSDREFCLMAVREAGVAAIPVSAFYAVDPVESIVRLCLAKKDETLDAGIEALAAARRRCV
jgi:aspartate/methionine/tyrosine aminotransferase